MTTSTAQAVVRHGVIAAAWVAVLMIMFFAGRWSAPGPGHLCTVDPNNGHYAICGHRVGPYGGQQ